MTLLNKLAVDLIKTQTSTKKECKVDGKQVVGKKRIVDRK